MPWPLFYQTCPCSFLSACTVPISYCYSETASSVVTTLISTFLSIQHYVCFKFSSVIDLFTGRHTLHVNPSYIVLCLISYVKENATGKLHIRVKCKDCGSLHISGRIWKPSWELVILKWIRSRFKGLYKKNTYTHTKINLTYNQYYSHCLYNAI